MKIEKKYIVAGSIMLVSISLGLLYLQIQKMKDFCISLTQIKLNNFTWTSADIDVFLKFGNKSSIKLTLFSQEYNVYINNKFVVKASNSVPQTIAGNSFSNLAVKLQFSPKDVLSILQIGAIDLISHPQNIVIKISANLKAGVGVIKFNVPYEYVTTLKEIMTSSKSNDKKSITC